MVDFQGMHFNVRKSLYIHFQNHHSIFRKVMISTIDCGGEGWFSVLLTSICATTNNFLPIEDRYSGLICQHALANILNVYQRFIKSLQQPTKPQWLAGQFPNRRKGNKDAYYSINDFICKSKEDIDEPIATRNVKDITGVTTRDDDEEKLFLPHHTSKHQYYKQWCFQHISIVTETKLGMKSYTTSPEYEPRPFYAAWYEGSTRLDFELHRFL